VKQTVERHADCVSLAEQAFARHLYEKTKPTEAELLQLLQRFARQKQGTFYFLDALDEAPDRVQPELVKKLASLGVRLFITSRSLKTVENCVPGVHSFAIAAQDHDLDLHIDQEIEASPDLRSLLHRVGSSLRKEIVTSIKEKCNGM
jgi:ankyrin repeat domain-containing protein 50